MFLNTVASFNLKKKLPKIRRRTDCGVPSHSTLIYFLNPFKVRLSIPTEIDIIEIKFFLNLKYIGFLNFFKWPLYICSFLINPYLFPITVEAKFVNQSGS